MPEFEETCAQYFTKRIGPARDVLRVEDVETPTPGAGEVRVRLRASGVNPSDVKSRGLRKLVFPRVTPHSDGAGEIEAVGAGVPASRIGERVWIWNGQWQRPSGTAAEFIVLPAAQAAPLPKNVSFEEGACLGIPAMTAYQAIELAAADKNTTLFVSGGAGSVSQYAIQFAKARGATVITTISSPDKAKRRAKSAPIIASITSTKMSANVLRRSPASAASMPSSRWI